MITNRLIHRCVPLALAAAVMLGLTSCGPGNGLNMAKVSGKVTYKGQPVTNGTVFFVPDESKGTVGPPAVGSITANGTYVMSTESAGDGVIVGSHKVGITGVESTPVSDEGAVDPEKDAANFMKAKAKAAQQATRQAPKKDGEEFFTDKGGKKYRFLIPMKFSRPEESGITVKVEGNQTVNFDVDESNNVKVNP